MKKFLIALLVIVLLLLGGAGYALFANDSAMLAVFSQNQEKIVTTINNSLDRLNEQDTYKLECNTFMKEGEDYIRVKAIIQLARLEDESYEFISKKTLTMHTGGNTTTSNETMYYKDGVLVRDNEGEFENLGTRTIDNALLQLGVRDGFKLSSIFMPKIDEEDLEMEFKAKIALSFSPFYLGQKYIASVDVGFDYTVRINVSTLGNLKEIYMQTTDGTDEMEMSTKYLGTIKLTFPDGLLGE